MSLAQPKGSIHGAKWSGHTVGPLGVPLAMLRMLRKEPSLLFFR